jgi:hypothetical protein
MWLQVETGVELCRQVILTLCEEPKHLWPEHAFPSMFPVSPER